MPPPNKYSIINISERCNSTLHIVLYIGNIKYVYIIHILLNIINTYFILIYSKDVYTITVTSVLHTGHKDVNITTVKIRS